MISIEEIIALQKQDEAVKKQSELEKKRKLVKVFLLLKGINLRTKRKRRELPLRKVPPRPNKQPLPKTLPNPSKMGKEKWGNQLRLLLLLGNVRARKVQLRCFLFPLPSLQMKGW